MYYCPDLFVYHLCCSVATLFCKYKRNTDITVDIDSNAGTDADNTITKTLVDVTESPECPGYARHIIALRGVFYMC